MKAIILKSSGDADQLEYAEVDQPSIKPDEVLVAVKAFSINPVDIKTRNGKALYEKLKDESPLILGWDIAGTVEQVGAKVTEFKTGDRVFGMINFPGHGQAYAEYAAAPADHLALIPEQITFPEAAGATLAALTAWQDLYKVAQVNEGQRVLIHGASGGVGHFAVQMAKHLGAYVIGTSSAPNKDFVIQLGADKHIDYKNENFKSESNLDLVFDTVGPENVMRSIETLKAGGSILSIVGGIRGEAEERIKARKATGKNTMVKSSGEDMRQIASMLEKGQLKSHVSEMYPFDHIKEAHQQVSTGHTVGKVVVSL